MKEAFQALGSSQSDTEFFVESQAQERLNRQQKHNHDREKDKDQFKREFTIVSTGLAAGIFLLGVAVFLSVKEHKNESAMVAGVAGGLTGCFSVYTQNTLGKKNKENE